MTSLVRLGPAILENRCGKAVAVLSRYGNSSENGYSPSKKNRPMVTAEELNLSSNESRSVVEEVDELAAPTTCCMSGCTNCVWIQYAELISEKLKQSDENVQKIIMEKVEDPNMRAFLSMELRCRNLSKS